MSTGNSAHGNTGLLQQIQEGQQIFWRRSSDAIHLLDFLNLLEVILKHASLSSASIYDDSLIIGCLWVTFA